MPKKNMLAKIKVLNCQLNQLYLKATKDNPQQQFNRMVAEGQSMPQYRMVQKWMDELHDSIPEHLDELTESFGRDGKLSIRTERTSTKQAKQVS